MPLFNQTPHQKKQIEVINTIENQVKNNSLSSSTVEPVEDFENDPRLCLTGIHLPDQKLVEIVHKTLIDPLRTIYPNYDYYAIDSLHMTVKNVRIINNPPTFIEDDIQKAKKVFEEVVPKHKSYRVYFYRLLLFPSNLALIGTTDPELDLIVLDLDQKLKDAGIPDDKKYSNLQYFFSNITLARFNSPVSKEFIKKVEELSQNINIEPYTIVSVTLLVSNAVLKKRRIIGTWNLR